MGLGRGGLCLTAAVMGGSLLAGPVVALALSNGLPNTQVAFAIGLAIVWVGQLLGWLGLRRDESRILTRSRAVAGTLLILLPLLILALLVDGTVLADR